MTTFSTVFGMLPIALGKGDGSASRAALASTVVGGQMLCLLITPVVYSMFDDLRGGRLFAWVKLPVTKALEAFAWERAGANGRRSH